MKRGDIVESHLQNDKFLLSVDGFEIKVLKISGLEQEYVKVDMPDGTSRPTGNVNRGTVTITIQAHHIESVAFIEDWFSKVRDGVAEDAEKDGILEVLSHDELKTCTINLNGMFPSKWSGSDLEKKTDAEMVEEVYEFNVNDIRRIIEENTPSFVPDPTF